MKEGIHPEWYPEAEVVCDGEVIMTVGATQPRIVLDIWSGTHPFYTGQSRLIDTEGQVDRFMRRLQRLSEIKEEAQVAEAEAAKSDPRNLAIESLELMDSSTNETASSKSFLPSAKRSVTSFSSSGLAIS